MALASILLAGCGAESSDRPPADGEAASVEEPAAVAPTPGPELPTRYLAGLRSVTSPDGREFRTATESLIKQVWDAGRGERIDSVLVDGRLVEMRLRPSGPAGVYRIESEDGDWAGTLTFERDPWSPGEWSVDLVRRDGLRVEGIGRDNGEAVLLETTAFDGSGSAVEAVVERMPYVQRSIFEAKRGHLVR